MSETANVTFGGPVTVKMHSINHALNWSFENFFFFIDFYYFCVSVVILEKRNFKESLDMHGHWSRTKTVMLIWLTLVLSQKSNEAHHQNLSINCYGCLSRVSRWSYTGWPHKNGTVNFLGLCSDQQLSLFTLMDRTSFPRYNNTKIIKFGWKLFMLWVISYGLSFLGFAINFSLVGGPPKNGTVDFL